MKVCIPSLGNRGLEEEVSQHFGRAPNFTILNTQTSEVKIIENKSEHFGGVESSPDLIAKEGADTVLCSSLGPRAIDMFEQLGIRVYVGAGGIVKDAIHAFQEGRLQEATNENACKNHRH